MSLSSNTTSDIFIFDKIHLIHYEFFHYQIMFFRGYESISIMAGTNENSKARLNGIHHTLLLKENLDEEKLEVLQLLENLAGTNWTTNISKLPSDKIVHSSVKNYFKNSNDAKHIKEGCTFSETEI